MTTYVLSPLFNGWQGFNSAGQPLSAGTITVYSAGTTTPVSTWTTSAGSVTNSNPITLNAGGFPPNEIWVISGNFYKFVVKDSSGSTINTYDNVYGAGDTAAVLAALADTASTANGDALIGVKHTGTGGVATTLHDRIEGDSFLAYDFLSAAQRSDIRANTITLDCTSAYQAALDAAYAAGVGSVQAMDGTARIDGMLTIPCGVTLYGNTSSSEYYVGAPGAAVPGAKLYKTSANGTAGPLIELASGSGIRGLYLYHNKQSTSTATAGIVRIGAVGAGVSLYSSAVVDCRMYGYTTGDVTGATTCYGIYFPPSTSTAQRYFNVFQNVTITNLDVGVRLNSESNCNRFTGLTIRNAKYYVEIDGTGTTGAIENTFAGLILQYIGTAPANSIVFVLRASALNNVFAPYSTECQGSLYGADDATCVGNIFMGHENELTPSSVYAGSTDHYWSRPTNVSGQSNTILVDPARTTDKYTFGRGSKVSDLYHNVTGTLPQCNGGAYPQALVAADADSKIIVNFPSMNFKKSLLPSFYCKLKVFANAPANAGVSIAECEFLYRTTNTAAAAGSLSVLRCSVKGAAIAGLFFVSGKTGGTEFRIGIVGGTATATVMNYLLVSIDIEGMTYETNVLLYSAYQDFLFATAAATANDVTDSITLLTVADTAV